MKKEEFLEKARGKHGYKYTYHELPDKIKLKDKIKIYFNGTLYDQTVSKHLLGRCPEKSTPIKSTEEFIKECISIWDNKYDYSLVKYTGALNDIDIIYDGIVYKQRASSHLMGLSPEFRNNEESLFKQKINKSDEYGIIEIERFLIKYDISYLKNKKINNILFQFYISDRRTVIEYMSNLHYLIKDVDKIKNDYCEDNYINLIRIRYDQFDDIYQILWNNLKS